MYKIFFAIAVFILGAATAYFAINSSVLPTLSNDSKEVGEYALYEDGTQPGFAPQIMRHKLEIISNDTFLYSADGHMTYDRVRGEIVRENDSYNFVVTESYQGRYKEDDSLFSTQSMGEDKLLVEWRTAKPLLTENNTFSKK